ncbi:MAG: lysine transporter LysE [Flavipsychrobacter sp.]|jgi:threonine/homoserine/homoserine lactone efflux protein|nr:lysine transporter LysE [Flavipsychrobacter sp.]
MTDAIIKGILVGLFMAISVGPTLFVIIKYSLHYSHKAGVAFVLGVSVSDALYVTLANVAANWLRALAPYEKYIATGGAIALMAIGLSGMLTKYKPKRPSSIPMDISRRDYFKIWLGGFLVNTLNPGVIVTWLGAVTIIANKPGSYRLVLFGVALLIILGIDFVKVFLADKIKVLLTVRRVIYMQRFSAACIFLIGLTLLITTIFSKPAGNGKDENSINRILSCNRPPQAP